MIRTSAAAAQSMVSSAEKPRRGSLLCNVKNVWMFLMALAVAAIDCSAWATTWHVNGTTGNDVAAAADGTGATTEPSGGDQHPHSGGGFYCNSSQASNLSASRWTGPPGNSALARSRR